MKFSDLSPEQQALVNTDFGEMDKVAAAAVAHVTECYEYGFDKLATEIADAQDAFVKQAEEDEKKEKEKEELDEHGEKTAAESGAFIERGLTDGLAKLGQERHGDPLHYFYPYMEQKIAEAGAQAALQKAAGMADTARKGLEAVKSVGKGAVEAVKGRGQDAAEHARRAIKGTKTHGAPLTAGQRAGHAGKALAHAAVPAAGVGGVGFAGHRLFGKKKEETAAAAQ